MEGDISTTVEPVAPVARDDAVLFEGWWVNILGTVAVLVMAGVWLGVRKFINTVMDKMNTSEAEKEAINALLAGMAEQQPIANGIKKAAVDGKITKDEAKALETSALEIAKKIATGPARDIVVTWSGGQVSSLVKQLLSKFKSRA